MKKEKRRNSYERGGFLEGYGYSIFFDLAPAITKQKVFTSFKPVMVLSSTFLFLTQISNKYDKTMTFFGSDPVIFGSNKTLKILYQEPEMVRMSIILVFMLSSLIWQSCSSTHVVYNNPYAYGEFNQAINDRSVKIEKNDGSIFETDSVWADSAGLSYRAEPHMNVTGLPFEKINRIKYIDRGTGAILGSLIGISSGVVVAQATEPSEKSRFSGLAQLGGAFLGFLCGVTFGASIGHTNYYQFSSETPPQEWWAKIDTTRYEDKTEPNLIQVEVTSAEHTPSGMILIHWRDKTIRLDGSKVQRVERQGEKVTISIYDNVYENKFKLYE